MVREGDKERGWEWKQMGKGDKELRERGIDRGGGHRAVKGEGLMVEGKERLTGMGEGLKGLWSQGRELIFLKSGVSSNGGGSGGNHGGGGEGKGKGEQDGTTRKWEGCS
ncbi:hypothetical protein ACH5RR_029793 [Cinchona calisaya]|uniref:Uncharacterized protein n=1 Tax=Cinchona calisaya TaxID=153742 RepID=A0ABD2YX22_9GENT